MSDGISTKAKIVTSLGAFEFEGTEDFIKTQIENILKQSESGANPVFSSDQVVKAPVVQLSQTQSQTEAAKAIKKTLAEIPKMLPDLFPTPDAINKLKKFISDKNAQSHFDIFISVIYWLKKEMGVNEVSIDEMWTAYKVLGKKPPKVLIQALRDIKSKKGWLSNGSELGKYSMAPLGETYVEFDLSSKNTKNAPAQ